MKRDLFAVLVLVAAVATAMPCSNAAADDNAAGPMGGLGFRSTDAPIGIRWWFTSQFGVDVDGGFTSENLNYSDLNDQPANKTFNSFTVDVGLPVALKSWESAKFVLRPGFELTQRDDIDTFLAEAPFIVPSKKKITDYSVTGEVEVEVFVAKSASISASHGFGFASSKGEDAKRADTVFGTFGSNFTTLGFHVYLWK